MNNFKAAVTLKLETILINLNKYRKDDPLQVHCDLEEKPSSLWLHLTMRGTKQSLSFPRPYLDAYKNYVIGDRVKRAVGTWMHGKDEYSYWNLMSWVLIGRIETAFAGVGKRSQLERIILSLESGQAPHAFKSLQGILNGIINDLPLTGTPLETHALCNRVCFLDPSFAALSPQDALDYQKQKNLKFFPWTSVGLSDSGMCNNNLLKLDLRKLTPFGEKHHNPMRNLYQTLGMRGDEPPTIQTKSMAELTKSQGVARRGWNWLTCFLDTPLNFEDQLIVSTRHMDKFTTEQKRLLCFGGVQVSAGQELSEGDVISLEPNNKPLGFWVRADRAIVTAVEPDTIAFNGQERKITWVYVETKHTFKEGIKLTNRHGNKGVVTFADTGTMLNAATGLDEDIDIIVSAKTVSKRKNFGQVMEALTGLAWPGKNMVLADGQDAIPQVFEKLLVAKGHAADGTSEVTTSWFNGRTLCGPCFWGLIKNPETQLWTKAEVAATDNRGRRMAGVKLSHIEFRGLTTIFGPGNPIVAEILSHQQGVSDVTELIDVLEALRGKTYVKPVLDWSTIKPVDQSGTYFHTEGELAGTIVDETLSPEGFMLTLPRMYHIFTPDKERADVEYRLVPTDTKDLREVAKPDGVNTFLDKIYVPYALLRSNWQHPTGKWGLSDLGGYLNNIVTACHKMEDGEAAGARLKSSLDRYFGHVARRLSTKRGEISTFALAVRYQHSTKATATLAKAGLPYNHVEIHRNMAEGLGVKDGDYVIAERFPCLGFKSLPIQRVRVTDDPQCKLVIRVSGNSLVSQGLDFDGDVLFLMSFKTEAANALLEKEFNSPDPRRKAYLEEANSKKQPFTGTLSLSNLNLLTFDTLTAERQAEIVESLTGIKRGTGSTVALTYNVMRIAEGSVKFSDKETNLALEVIADTVANSVFAQKHHGEESLEARCKKAICTADLKDMIAMGFPKKGSERLCSIIREEASQIGVSNLERHYENHLTKGKSSVVNLIVRKKRRFYFATRSNLNGVRLLQHLEDAPVDLTSHLWKKALERNNNEVSQMQG